MPTNKFTTAAEGHYQGLLVKLARYSKRNWKTRFFTLTASPPQLCYYKKKGDSKEAGKVIIDASTTAEVADARPNCFRISNNSYGDLYVQAPSKAEMDIWMSKLNFVAQLSKQSKQAWRKSVARGASSSPAGSRRSSLDDALGTTSSPGLSSSTASSTSNQNTAARSRKRRNVKVQLTIEKFLNDRDVCRQFFESADGLILSSARDHDPAAAEGTPKRVARFVRPANPDMNALFPAKPKKKGISSRLKNFLDGIGIDELSIPSVSTTSADAGGGGSPRPGQHVFRVQVRLTDDAVPEWTVERTATDFWNLHQQLCDTYPKLAERVTFPTTIAVQSDGKVAAAATATGGVDAVDRLLQSCADYLEELCDIQLYGSNLEELWMFVDVFGHLKKPRSASIDVGGLDDHAVAAAAAADAMSSRKHRGPCLQRMHEMALSDPQGYKKLSTAVRGIISGLVSPTARSIKEYVQSWTARAKTGLLTPDRMKELKEVKQYVEYQAHEITTKHGESLLRKMPSCPRESFETFVYLEVEAAVIPPLREQLYRYLEMETHDDDALIEQNIRKLQARGMPMAQAAFAIEPKMQSASNYFKSVHVLDHFVYEERPSVQLELILDFVECVQNEACDALKENGNDLMDLAADDLLPLMTYIISSSSAFLESPYTSLQFIRELSYHVAARGEAMYFLTSMESAVYFMRDFDENMRQGHPENVVAALAAASPRQQRKSLQLHSGMYADEAFEIGGGGGAGGFVIDENMAIDVTISKAYLKDVDDSNHKVPHYMAVSEVIGAGGKVAVTHFRYSDLYALHSRLAQDAANAPLPRFPERSKYDVLMRLHLKTKSLDRTRQMYQEYLQLLVMNPKVLRSPLLRDFLNFK